MSSSTSSWQAQNRSVFWKGNSVVGDELERLAGQKRLLPGHDAALLFPVLHLRFGLEGDLDADLVGDRDGRGFQEKQLYGHFVSAGDRVEVGDLALVALADEARRAAAVLGAVGYDDDAVVAAEGEHELLLRLRIPEGRADIAAVAVELGVA